jgi:hypothetical protein
MPSQNTRSANPTPQSRRRTTRRRLVVLLILAVPAALLVDQLVVRSLLNPLRRPPESIADSLLVQTPPGSTRAEVVEWVDAQDWRHGGRPFALNEEPPVQRILGHYYEFGFDVAVFAEWVFGDDGRLQTVEVSKMATNAP